MAKPKRRSDNLINMFRGMLERLTPGVKTVKEAQASVKERADVDDFGSGGGDKDKKGGDKDTIDDMIRARRKARKDKKDKRGM